MIALISVFSLYLMLSILAVLYFGKHNIQPSLFDNFANTNGWFALIVLNLFTLIFLCNIPFVFFGGKVALHALLETVNRLRAVDPTERRETELDECLRPLETVKKENSDAENAGPA